MISPMVISVVPGTVMANRMFSNSACRWLSLGSNHLSTFCRLVNVNPLSVDVVVDGTVVILDVLNDGSEGNGGSGVGILISTTLIRDTFGIFGNRGRDPIADGNGIFGNFGSSGISGIDTEGTSGIRMPPVYASGVVTCTFSSSNGISRSNDSGDVSPTPPRRVEVFKSCNVDNCNDNVRSLFSTWRYCGYVSR